MAGEPADGVTDAAEVVPTPSLDTSASWVVADGSLQQAIAFDTSSSLDSDGPGGSVSSSKGTVFLTAPSEEYVPCDVHICFRQKHDVHRIYVRSTARVYEIYHAVDPSIQNNEYLCTVRCGMASTKILLPETDIEKLSMEQCTLNQTSTCVSETLPKCTNNNGNNEDGWVEVKIPESPVIVDTNETPTPNSDGKSTQKPQICYEATAEISDLSPCMSLTLRLLSLETKSQLYIEEIYILADPVTSETSGLEPASNLGGTSLLSVLLPGLMQLPRSANRGLEDKYGSHVPEKNIVENIETINPCITSGMLKESYFTDTNFIKHQEQPPPEASHGNADAASSQEVPITGMDKSFHGQSNPASDRTEKMLEELIHRVGKLETLCFSFVEKMTEPLSSIEMKLQKVEQQLEILTERANNSKPLGPSKISAPEFTCDESVSGDKDDILMAPKHKCKLVVSTFGHLYDSDPVNKDGDMLMTLEQKHRSTMPRNVHIYYPNVANNDHDALMNPEPKQDFRMASFGHIDESNIRPGFVLRAPEFEQSCSTSCCSNATSSDKEILSEEKRTLEAVEGYDKNDERVSCDQSMDLEERNTSDKTYIFSAPELSSEDFLTVANASASTQRCHTKDRSASSIDTALASALEAFLSFTVKSGRCDCSSDPQGFNCNDGKNNIHPVTNAPSENVEKSEPVYFDEKPKSDHLEVVKNVDDSEVEKIKNIKTVVFSSPPGTYVQERNGDFTGKITRSQENNQSSANDAGKIESDVSASDKIMDWCFNAESIDSQNAHQIPFGSISKTHDDQLLFSEDISSVPIEDPIAALHIGGSFADSDIDEADPKHSRTMWFAESSTESIANVLTADSDHIGWSEHSSSDSVEVQSPLPSWLTGGGIDCLAETENLETVSVDNDQLNTAGLYSPTLSHTVPRTDVETEGWFIQHPILNFETVTDESWTGDSLFKDLFGIDVQTCDVKDDARETENEPLNHLQNLDDFCSSSAKDPSPINIEGFPSEAYAHGSSEAVNRPLVDIEEVVSTIEASDAKEKEHSRCELLDEQPSFTGLI